MQFDGFDWDKGNWPKCGNHGLTQNQIETIFRNDPIIFADPKHSVVEDRFNAIGSTLDGRLAFVVFTFRPRLGKVFVRPLSARYMHKKEIDYYETQQFEKGPTAVFER